MTVPSLLGLALLLLTGSATPITAQRNRSFAIVETSIGELQKALKDKRVTSRELVTAYLVRIATYEDKLNAVITVNPNALAEAEQLDRERAQRRVRGPLHGIPIAIKDNILTAGLTTTGGALAFEGFVPSYDATLVKNLKDAGAIIIAKTVLTELANWIAAGMPANYSALGGYGMNPYDPRKDPRSGTDDGRPLMTTGGSSSGIGTAASFWAANVGTETSGSILSPANALMLAAIKPTVGRISRYGVIPITADQDTPGPIARSVADAAVLLGVLEGAPDPRDPATTRCERPRSLDYTVYLKADGLKNARIGIPRANYYDPIVLSGSGQRGGLNPEQSRVMEDAIRVLKREGAVVVDPVEIPSVSTSNLSENLLLWDVCRLDTQRRGSNTDCSTVFTYGMKRDFNDFLRTLGASAPVKSLTELRNWNEAHRNMGAIKYGQLSLELSDEMDLEADRLRYQVDREKDLRLSATNGIDAAMKTHRLDALLFPGAGGASIAAKPGYPTVIVPFAKIPNTQPLPSGFDAKPSPFGVSFTGMACSEPKLIELGFAFERATRSRVPPTLP